jgi:hypothetical protein
MRFLLFLYSTRNLVGCALALVGLGLFFIGVIDQWWQPIVAGLYAMGWLAVPRDHSLEISAQNEATQTDLTQSINILLEKTQGKLPREAVERLQQIRETVTALAPKLFGGGMAMNYAVSLVNAVTRDLPETVENYVKLPPAFATLHIVDNGKTCKALLLDQLNLLGAQLNTIAENVYKDDADALVLNGKFLEEKFHSLSFIG